MAENDSSKNYAARRVVVLVVLVLVLIGSGFLGFKSFQSGSQIDSTMIEFFAFLLGVPLLIGYFIVRSFFKK